MSSAETQHPAPRRSWYQGKHAELLLQCECGGHVLFEEGKELARCPGCSAIRHRREWAAAEEGICPACGGGLFRRKDHRHCGIGDRQIRCVWRVAGQVVTSCFWYLDQLTEKGRLEAYLAGEERPLQSRVSGDTIAWLSRGPTCRLRVSLSEYRGEIGIDIRLYELEGEEDWVPRPAGVRIRSDEVDRFLDAVAQGASQISGGLQPRQQDREPEDADPRREIRREFAMALRKLRRLRGWSMEDAAEAMGISEQAWIRMERAKLLPYGAVRAQLMGLLKDEGLLESDDGGCTEASI